MSEDFLFDRRAALEESFFRRRNAELLEEMKQQLSAASQRDALSVASGINDEELLDRLSALNLTAETVSALSLVPLVQVAWADDKLAASEREAILSAAVEVGITKDSAAYKLLLSWLDSVPEPDVLSTWTEYVRSLSKSMSAEDTAALRDGLMLRAQQVASAAGGVLGMGNKISAAEQATLDQLKAAFETSSAG